MDPLNQIIRRRSISGAKWTLSTTLMLFPLNVISNAIVARALGVTEYGTFAAVIAINTLCVILANLGVSEAVTVFGLRAFARSNSGRLEEILSLSRTIHVFVSLPIYTALSYLLIFRSLDFWFFLYFCAGTVSALFSSEYLRVSSMGKTSSSARIAFYSNLLVQISLITTAVFCPRPIVIVAIKLFVASLSGLVVLLICEKPKQFNFSFNLISHIKNKAILVFLANSFFLALITGLISGRLSVILMDLFRTSKETSLYALAFGVAVQVTILTDWIYESLRAPFSRVAQIGSSNLASLFRRIIRLNGLFMFIVYSISACGLFFIVPLLYGAQFARATLIVPLVLIFLAIQNASRVLTLGYYSLAKNSEVFLANIGAVLMLISLGLILVPNFGAVGMLFALFTSGLMNLAILISLWPSDSSVSSSLLFADHLMLIVNCLSLFTITLLIQLSFGWFTFWFWACLGLAILTTLLAISQVKILKEDLRWLLKNFREDSLLR